MIHVNDDSFSSPASFLLDLPLGTYVVPTNPPALDVSPMRTGIKLPLSGKQKTSPTFSWQKSNTNPSLKVVQTILSGLWGRALEGLGFHPILSSALQS